MQAYLRNDNRKGISSVFAEKKMESRNEDENFFQQIPKREIWTSKFCVLILH